MIEVIQVVVGLVLLLLGGELIVRGASNLAKTLGVPPLVIGLTVVAFGTSVPELGVNLAAALRGNSELCFGNVVGSNIANIGLVLGLAALLAPVAIAVKKPIVTREIPIMLLSVLTVLALGLDRWLDGGENRFSHADALVLLLLFGVFLYSTAYNVRKGRDHGAQELIGKAEAAMLPPSWKSGLLAVLGFGMLAVGGELTVAGATTLAVDLGVSEAVIGLTVVSVGTSLPELVTSIMATRRGEADLAVGNVVGSNIFNLLLVLGASSAISPVTLASQAEFDLALLTVLSFLLLPMAVTGSKLDRNEGALLLVCYVGYLSWRVWTAIGG